MNGATFAFVALSVMAALWLWVAAALRIVYRPRRPRDGPMPTELRDEPPAVVTGLGVSAGVRGVWRRIALSATKDAGPGAGPRLWSVVAAIAVVVVTVVAATGFGRDRQRDTDAGLAAASYWLGVRRGYVEV